MSTQRHAVLITAYHDFAQLERLVEAVNGAFQIYVHIDLRSTITLGEQQSLAARFDCHMFREYPTGWGSSRIIDAVLLLAGRALDDPAVEYLHIITGQDWPVGSPDRIADYVEVRRGANWMSAIRADSSASIRLRYEARWLPDAMNLQKPIARRVGRALAAAQICLGMRRKKIGPFAAGELYKGLLWCSLTRSAFEYVFDFCEDNPRFLRDLRTCKIPEEFFIQTILMNSAFREQIVTDHKRFVLWERKNGAAPGILDESDLTAIAGGDFLFARKFASGVSDDLALRLRHVA